MFKGTYLPQFKDLVCFGILVNVNQKSNIARIANLNQQKIDSNGEKAKTTLEKSQK